jgi:hypothetical protein
MRDEHDGGEADGSGNQCGWVCPLVSLPPPFRLSISSVSLNGYQLRLALFRWITEVN